MSFDLKVNRLPARTWNHLGMNEAVLKNIRIDTEGRFEAKIPEEICVDAEKGCCAKAPEEASAHSLHKAASPGSFLHGSDGELERLLQAQKIPVHSLLVPPGAKIQQPARFHFSYQSGDHVFDRITVTAQENSELTLVMDLSSPDLCGTADGAASLESGELCETAAGHPEGGGLSGAAAGHPENGELSGAAAGHPEGGGLSRTAAGHPEGGTLSDTAAGHPEGGGLSGTAAGHPEGGGLSGTAAARNHINGTNSFAGIQTKIHARKNSLLRLIQIQRLGNSFTFYNDIESFCEEGARLEIVQLVLGGQSTFLDCRTELAGKASSLEASIGYLVQKEEKLDMNYAVFHEGKQTKSEINAHGVLRDRAFKLFRGTIDFQTGASGSEGEEKEDVLLLDDGVVNQTIPLILCAEEDVQGSHGATIGELDDALLFYLESRGIPRPEIYEMMARARLETVCQKIPDAEARRLAQDLLEKKTTVRTAGPETSDEAAPPQSCIFDKAAATAAQHSVSVREADAKGGTIHEYK